MEDVGEEGRQEDLSRGQSFDEPHGCPTARKDLLYEYVHAQTREALASGTFDVILDALDAAMPAALSSDLPRDLYALYLQRGLVDRARQFRAEVIRVSPSWRISYDESMRRPRGAASPGGRRDPATLTATEQATEAAAGVDYESGVTSGSGVPLQVNRNVCPRRTLPTSAGRKHATHVPPRRRTLGYTTPSESASNKRSASAWEAT
jgi:hypothetical protein